MQRQYYIDAGILDACGVYHFTAVKQLNAARVQTIC